MDKKNHTILIIEDNELNREILMEILHDEYNVLQAENGLLGLQILRRYQSEIDVVLLDIQMPVMNGYEVIQEVRKDNILKEIPIIVTTSNESTDEELRCLQMGATDFVKKPYVPTLVRVRIGNIIHLKESAESNELKTKFINNISHEIRTPLNALVGFSQLLGMPNGTISDEDREMYVGYIKDSSKMLLWMIEDVLVLSDIDQSKLRIKKGDAKINDISNGVIAATKNFNSNNLQLVVKSELPDSYTIYTDTNRVQQILVKLISNAFKWATEGDIIIRCNDTENPGFVSISVEDTGAVIPADKAEFIFERFTKIDEFIPGNGLGLSIARQLAQYIDAKIYLDTKFDKGARFVLAIPLG